MSTEPTSVDNVRIYWERRTFSKVQACSVLVPILEWPALLIAIRGRRDFERIVSSNPVRENLTANDVRCANDLLKA